MKKLLPPVLFVTSCAIMLLLHFFIPLKNLIPFPFNLIGIIPMTAGLLLSGAGSNKFKKVGTTIMTFDKPGILVTDGFFKYSRNPMYLGFAIGLFGLFVILGSVTPLLIVIAFIAITDRWYIKFEESMLIDKFGDKYLSYKKKTRRWM